MSTPVIAQTWLQKHERLVLATLVLGVSSYLGQGYLNHRAEVDSVKATAAVQIAEQKTATAQALAAQTAADAQLIQQERTQHDQEIASLVASLAARKAETAQKVSQVLSPKTAQEAVDELSTTYTLPKPVTVMPDGADVPTEDLQQFTATKVRADSLAQDSQTAGALMTQYAKERDDQTKLAGDLSKQVDALNAEVKTNNAACQAEITAAKAQGHKNSVKWFKRGFIVGFVTGLWAGHAAGL